MNYCNNTCSMYDADNGECCATDEARVLVALDAECFFDAYDRDHPYTEPKPTNADRIRSMSDEELSKLLLRVETHGWIKGNNDSEDDDLYDLDWLQQPEKEE